MDMQTIKSALIASNWTEDRYGHFISITGKYRVKIQKTSIRLEKEFRMSPTEYDRNPKKEWLNIVSDYVKNVTIVDGKLCIKGCEIKVLKTQ